MRGDQQMQDPLFTYLSLEDRIGKHHPLRRIKIMVDALLRELSGEFEALYAPVGRPSIPPEYLLRASLLQALYSIRSETLLIEEINYNLLFRWFIGLSMDDEVWDHSTFTKNR
jgi:transposase